MSDDRKVVCKTCIKLIVDLAFDLSEQRRSGVGVSRWTGNCHRCGTNWNLKTHDFEGEE